MNKKGKVIVSILSVFLIVIGIIFSALQIGKAEDTAGKIILNKTAVATTDRKAKVTLEIQTSELKQPTSDIIIIMDRSGSMANCAETSSSNGYGKIGGFHPGGPGEPGDKPSGPTTCDSRLDVAKESASDLAEKLLPTNGNKNVKIGIVVFGTKYESQYSTTKYSDMSSDLSAIKKKITDIDETNDNGTNVQAGLNAAKNLLKDSTADNKIIILISDGIPTYFSLSNGSVCGNGNSDALAFNDSQDCKNSGLIPSTAAEKVAKEIKGNPIKAEIYAVGFGSSANDIASFLTNQIASTATKDKTYAYSASDTEALEAAMSKIASSIKNVLAKNATVTDKIPASFSLTAEAQEKLQEKYGDNITITKNEDGTTTIEVKYDEISSVQGTYAIEYEVEADEDHYGAMYTNVKATFTATATDDNTYYQNKNISEEFNKPAVAISMVTKDDDYTKNEKYIVKEGTSITIDKKDSILNNDSLTIHTDKPSNALAESTVTDKIVIENQPTCGNISVNEDGTFSYTATEGCAGTESQTYDIKYHVVSTVTIDGQKYEVTSNTSTITIKAVKNPTSYVVKYLEKGTNKELAEEKEVENKYVYDTVTENAITITGYELATDEKSSKTIKLSIDEEDNVIIFYYTIKPADVKDPTVTKEGPNSITSASDAVDYTITYDTTINDYKGTATITIVDTLPYTIDKDKSNLDGGKYDETSKTITWIETISNIDTYTNGEKVISIKKNISVYYNYPEFTGKEQYISNKVNTNISVTTSPDKEKEITEDTPVDITGKLVVKHLYKDEKGQDQELVTTQPATEEKIGTPYQTSPVTKEGYKLTETPKNASGKYVEGTTTVIYYYERVEAEITDTIINKTSETEEIKTSKDPVKYNITYNATIKEYNGPVTITIVDRLPYAIDESKSDLGTGIYNSKDKTITWVINKEVNTYENKPEGETSATEKISISLEYTVVYKDLDASVDKVTNKVVGTIKVETTDPQETKDEVDVPVNIKGKVITHHVDESGNKLSSDVTTSGKVGTNYNTTEVIIAGYELKEVPSNSTGKYTEKNIEVTYVYKRLGATPTNPIITKTGTTEITSSTDKNEYTITYDAIVKNYKGNITVTLVDTLPYAIDITKSNIADGIYNEKDKTITWTFTYVSDDAEKDLEISITKVIEVYYKDINASTTSYTNHVKATLSDDIEGTPDNEKETTHTTEVNIKGKVTTHYYIKDTTTKLVDSITTTDKVGESYTTEAKDIEGYNIVSKTPAKYEGTYTEEDIVVIYEYTRKVAIITDETITKKSVLEEITKSNTLVDYQIVYTTKINDYKGTATVTIVDYLPYAIDESSSNLDGGKYNATNKTITWTEKIEGINTFQNDEYSVNVTKNIVVKYKNMASDKKVVNKVTGQIKTDTKTSNGKEAEEEIIASIKGDLIVKHIYKDEAGNEKVLDIEDKKTDYVGYTYTTSPKHFDGYTLSKTPDNKTGEYKEETTIVIYYYDRVPAEVTYNEVTKESTNKVVTNIKDAFKYTISYKTALNEYEGKAVITIVDHLSYPINADKSDLAGGKYNKNTLTITWIKEYDVNTYKDINKEIEVNLDITLYYEDLTPETRVVVNKVATKLELETTDPVPSESETETKLEVKGTVIANYIDAQGNVIANSVTLNGLVGEDYQTEEKEIEGYIFSKVEGNQEGQYIDGIIEVTYIYDKEGTGYVEPDLPPQTKVDNNNIYITLITSIILGTLILVRKKVLN